jgi:hypothetical protein
MAENHGPDRSADLQVGIQRADLKVSATRCQRLQTLVGETNNRSRKSHSEKTFLGGSELSYLLQINNLTLCERAKRTGP